MALEIEKLKKVVQDAGLTMEEQAAFYKVSAGGANALYISKTKKVSRVDISGFSFTHPAVTPLDQAAAQAKRIGRVRGQIDFSKSEEQIIEAFSTAVGLLKHLAGAGPRELGRFAKIIKGVHPVVIEDPRTTIEGQEKEAARQGSRGKKGASQSARA